MPPPALSFHPPLLNSASPWATDISHLRALLECPSTGAVTTRTSLLGGFDHRPESHRYAFFSPAAGRQQSSDTTKPTPTSTTHSFPDHEDEDALPASNAVNAVNADDDDDDDDNNTASLNNLGFSPLTLDDYLSILERLGTEMPATHHCKTVILSVTGTPAEVASCYARIIQRGGGSNSSSSSSSSSIPFPLAMEINLSCPNIPGHPPPAYEGDGLRSYIDALPARPEIPVGIKTPPYTHAGQFDTLVSTLARTGAGDRLSFLTATNTLGTCLILGGQAGEDPLLPGGGLGGMAGPPLHPLALGNVSTMRKRLDETDGLRHISIIGVGGVGDGQGYKRMRAVGASAVALATSLGKMGVSVFTKIEADIESSW